MSIFIIIQLIFRYYLITNIHLHHSWTFTRLDSFNFISITFLCSSNLLLILSVVVNNLFAVNLFYTKEKFLCFFSHSN